MPRDPGVYPVSSRMTLQQVIASAKHRRHRQSQQCRDLPDGRYQKLAALFSLKPIRQAAPSADLC
jgi:hypothetical protein